ncbi:LOW QUALITY PROTEIN: cilia- and flagella-associated protein 44 [Gadus macrocephalus]|uniref:LOW QUALITY PROTEIN: cilia- and flagella-associated protein 44 n=1 Tax=Gadus macrocephalus TaxID=80720 RepID=UPI0028CB54DD|nr:LOW QUALITY PROTEIN: cilia- and flagella-associated protein 44 [Gadus macrocephalus]
MASDDGLTQTQTNVLPRAQQDAESNGVSPEQPENEEDVATRLPVDMYYQYDELYSKPFATPDSDIPENLLNLSHSFGYDCGRRANLQLLDESTLAFIAGNVLVMLDISTKQQHYLRSCSGGGIGAIMSHPSKEYFAVAEKGHQPFIVVYEYPSLQPYRILRGGTALAYSYVDFSPDGSLLASMGSAPDYMLTLWDWKHEQVVLRCKAFSQEVYRVTFSPENPAHMTTSGSGHIKFWKMASTFTGLKLQGLLGMFGKTSLTDIECYVELPDGKVVSGSKWGNMLVWDGGLIKVEVCRKNKKTCHAGTIQQFSLDKGELMSIGADGAIRTWDFEILNTANASNDSGLFEMEPMNELRMGGNASLCSLVKSSVPESSIWFAQDSNGGVWRLDLSFSNISEEPTCLFTCHAGVIQGMDVSRASHLMATTALDCSVKVFDFLSKTELTCSQFKQGGTALIWAPSLVNEKGGLLVTGFQDGVVRLLELLDPQGARALAGSGDAELRLKQALKPHNAPVTAIAYERNGEVLATGSAEGTVFFFAVGEEYKPIGLINVPGPVQGLEWSPYSDCKSTLLVFCRSGHVVEVQPPEPVDQNTAKTYRLSGLPTRTFHFRSIRSRIKREEEVARRRVIKEARRIKSEERRRKAKEQGLEPTEEELQEEEDDEGDLPSIFIPEPPSPLFCGFRSEPGMFWLSMGGYDSGFLYHCRFSEEDQDRDPKGEPQDEPFAFLAVHNADGDPIHTVSFSEDQQLMLCGMHSGVLRAYPLGPADQRSLSSLGAYWALSLHDNQYGHLRHARFSHDGRFVLTAGEDGNIFSLSVPLPREHSPPGRESPRAKVPSPRERQMRDAMARETEERVAATRRELAWEQERNTIALEKLQQRFRDAVSWDTITVSAVDSEDRVSTYRLPAQVEVRGHGASGAGGQGRPGTARHAGPPGVQDGAGKDGGRKDAAGERQHASHLSTGTPGGPKVAGMQAERLQRAAEKAERAQAQIDTWKKKWAELYAAKPDENCEDPADVLAIQQAIENMGDFKLKTDKDYSVPEHLRTSADKKRADLVTLEGQVYAKKTEMNARVAALQEAKVRLVSRQRRCSRRLQRVGQQLPPHLVLPAPAPLVLRPEEVPERRLQYSRATLERYAALRADGPTNQTQEGKGPTLLEQLEQEMLGAEEDEEEDEAEEEDGTPYSAVKSNDIPMPSATPAATELEKELRMEQEIRLTYAQDCLLEQMAEARAGFDGELRLLRHQKLELDCQGEAADLQHVTLFQELLLLQDFEDSQSPLQGRLQAHRDDQRGVMDQLDGCGEQLEAKRDDIGKLQESDQAMMAALQVSVGKNHPFSDFLTRVFKKKIKRVKAKEPGEEEEEEMDSEEEEDEDSDEDDSVSNDGEALDDSVCPPNCELELFEMVIQMREQRLDLEDHLAEEKAAAESLKKEYDSLAKKLKVVQASVKAAEEQLEMLSRELQQRLNQLYVVVPLRLHQIEFVRGGAVPSDLSQAVVVGRGVVPGLQTRVQGLQTEKQQQREQYRLARQQNVLLLRHRAHMEAQLLEAEQRCTLKQMQKLGRLVDVEALPSLVANMNLQQEKSRLDTQLREAARAKEAKHWEAKLDKAQQALMEVTRAHTERLVKKNTLICGKRKLEELMKVRQKKKRGWFDGQRLREDLGRLRRLVRTQREEAQVIKREIHILSRKGGPVLPPQQLTPRPHPAGLLPPLPLQGGFVGNVSPKMWRTNRRAARRTDEGPSPGNQSGVM